MAGMDQLLPGTAKIGIFTINVNRKIFLVKYVDTSHKNKLFFSVKAHMARVINHENYKLENSKTKYV